ncbi:capsid protein [Alkalibaculum sp. M08DMB]|uniref:Capsid protein n=1 Tax=Alkalibaculum sporogenes TaxID=2655001 RepID=A0A6A7KA70_9FIRM|nr:capsid protein [Alkalibaculum sporogenes]MPW26255.1 capsid protein [Alkalibaculum sporogenes]
MATLNYAQQYLQALQQRFATGLRFNDLYNTPNNQTIKFVNAKTIQIPRIDVSGMVDVNRDAVGSFTRAVDNDYETKTLGHDREFRTLVDPVDIDEANMAISIANITRVFNDEQKIPEIDKYMASKLFSEFVDFGGTVDETVPSEANILAIYDSMMEEMDDAEVPQEGRILYVTSGINKILKNAQEMSRYIRVDQNTNNINRNVRSLDDVKIELVPSVRMKSVYDFTVGAVADASAVQVNMILVHPMSLIAPMKYEFVSLDPPSATTGGKYLYYERSYWDVFLIERKVNGVKINAAAAVI